MYKATTVAPALREVSRACSAPGAASGYPAVYDLLRRLRRGSGSDFDPHWRRSVGGRWVALIEAVRAADLGQALSAALVRWRRQIAIHDPATMIS
jgi:hypothetical protein